MAPLGPWLAGAYLKGTHLRAGQGCIWALSPC